MRYPDFLKEKGSVGFIAPSFGCATLPYTVCFDQTISELKKLGFSTVEGPNVRVSAGIGKSNTDEACGAEINDFFINKKSDVIISCGGGELMCEDLPFVDFKGIAKAEPVWYMGYSDNTNLTFLLPTLCDTAAIYGPCAAEFGMKPWHPALYDALDLLRGKKLSFSNYDGWESSQLRDEEHPYEPYNITEKYSQKLAGTADKEAEFEGRLIGGCLDCLVNLVGTPFDKVKEFNARYADEGIIWFIESCELNTMGVRRALWHMEQAGWFEHIKGFLVGRPMMYEDSFIDFTIEDAFISVLSKYNVPIVYNVDIGHISPMMPVISGGYGRVSAKENSLTVSYELK